MVPNGPCDSRTAREKRFSTQNDVGVLFCETERKRMIRALTRLATRRTILGLLGILMVAGILVAGLWPFHAPANHVTWLQHRNGLRFEEYGTVLSTRRVTWPSIHSSCTLEIWMAPALTHDSNTFLAFYAPRARRQFSLHQSNSDLVLRADLFRAGAEAGEAALYVDDVFRQGRPVFITITSGQGQTSIYINGAAARRSSNFPLWGEDLGAEVVIGTSPVQNDAWTGELFGLALYDRGLTPSQVEDDYTGLQTSGKTSAGAMQGAVVRYSFREGSGRTIHDEAGSGVDLDIPEHFTIANEKLLDVPWHEYHPGWGYWNDVAINVGGFVPLGFFLVAFLAERRVRKAALIAVLFGGLLSLAIETLQGFLPTRDSGLTDVITNTLGTGLGVLAYSFRPAQSLLNRILLVCAPGERDSCEPVQPEISSEKLELTV
jgi:hypothetical protein